MKVLLSFFRLIRWPNLFFIFLAQCLFQFCIYKPLFVNENSLIDTSFILMLTASILIAAAGYIINDYFDVNIDQVNKPSKVVVSLIISRRWVIFWHLIFSMSGIYLTTIAFPFKDYWHLHLANIVSVLLLWFYSTNLKKKIIIGNVVIALLTAWSIGVVYFSKFTFHQLSNPPIINPSSIRFFKLMILYTSFAFILTLVREALKDIEDMEGDEKYGCRTLPIAWGLKPTKVYISVWIVVVIAVLSIIQLYVVSFGWWMGIIYCIAFIILPLFFVLYKLPKAYSSHDFHVLSQWVKFSMLAGVVSMALFYFLP